MRQLAPSDIAQDLLGTARRALAGTVAGGAWMVWALITARAFTPPVIAALIPIAALLLGCCTYFTVKGTSLRKKHPFPRGPFQAGFLIVSILEGLGAAGVIALAQNTGRTEMLPDWIGIIIGLHFFGLAPVFRAPVYYFTGIGITVWCLLSWALLRGDAMAIAVGAGVGAMLWATTMFNLVRMWRRLLPRGGLDDRDLLA